jgi:hypothetical protein
MSAVPLRARRSRELGPQRVREISGRMGWGIVAWVVGIAFFLPVLWMVITAFKPESAAETWPPRFTFSPTLAQFRLVFSGWGPYVTRSVIAAVGSTILVLLLGVTAAYALSVHPVGRALSRSWSCWRARMGPGTYGPPPGWRATARRRSGATTQALWSLANRVAPRALRSCPTRASRLCPR